MDGIQPTSLVLLTLSNQLSQQTRESWQLGQILNALVLSSSPATEKNSTSHAPIFNTQLNIQGKIIPAQTHLKLPIGSTVPLEVTEIQDKIVLKLITPQTITTDPAEQLLKQALPKQDSILPLLEDLTQLIDSSHETQTISPQQLFITEKNTNTHSPRADTRAASSTSQNRPAALFEQLPTTVRTLIKNIIAQLPSPQTLSTAEGSKQTILNNGIFLESVLGQMAKENIFSATLPINLKNQLLQLSQWLSHLNIALGTEKKFPLTENKTELAKVIQQIKTSLEPTTRESLKAMVSDLYRKTESSIARLELNQLASLPDKHQAQNVWLLEIPIYQKNSHQLDLLQLQIEREKNASPQLAATQSIWHVTLAFDFETLGLVQTQIRIVEKKIDVHFYAERAQTHDWIFQALPSLATTFRQTGLNLDTLQSHHGQLIRPTTIRPIKILDIEI